MRTGYIGFEDAMLTELQQKRVWEGMLSSAIRANYFADIAGRFHRRQRAATWLTLFLSSGALVSILYKDLPEGPALLVRAGPTLLAAGISGYLLAVQNQKHAVDCADLHYRWNRLASDFENLWDDMYSPEALDRLKKLEEKAAELSKSATGLPNDEKAMAKWEDHVVSHRMAHVSA